MKVDLEALRSKIDLELKAVEQREVRLQEQIKHLAVVQSLAEAKPSKGPEQEGLDISDFREALFGGEG
jgi:hypothetical protein